MDATTFKSPLVNTGFNKFARSLLFCPPPAPAPLILCASSIKQIVLPFFFKPFNTILKRSSKSPLYLEPANIAPISKLYTSYPFKNSGHVPFTILKARPSAIAVLPTPGSPTKITLFLVLRPKDKAI